MNRSVLIIILFFISSLGASVRLNVKQLNNYGGLWYPKESEVPFTGIAYDISEVTGSVILERKYIKGLYSGKYNEWWNNGKSKIKGTYRNGLMNGRWKFYYENGELSYTGSYENANNGLLINGIKNIPKNGKTGLWTHWDLKGKKIEEGYFKEGEQVGKWAFWDYRGKRYKGTKIDYESYLDESKIKDRLGNYLVYSPKSYGKKKYINSFGSFRENKRDGEWIFFDINRKISALINYKQGEPNGKYITYHDKGHKLSEGIVDGLDEIGDLIKVGSWVYRNEKGKKDKEINYINGIQEGKTIYYSPDGQGISEVYFKKNKLWNGELTTWYPEGSKKESGQYNNGMKEGPWAFYYKNGQNHYIVNYHKNVKDGLFTEWDSFGRLVKEVEFEKGIKITEYIVEYYDDGYTEINKRNDMLYGPWVRWYSNEKKAEEGYFINDKRWGIWTIWYETGEKKFEGEYINNLKNSFHKKWNNDFQMVENIEYKDGKILSEYYYQKDKEGFLEFRKKNGVLNGGWTKWYNSELKFETGIYKEGKKIGEWTSWYKNRQKKYSAKYINGLLSGNFIEWDINGKKISDIQYKNGEKIQEFTVISNEDFIFEVNRVGGILEGLWKKMNVNLVLIEKGNYKQGLKIGTWYKFNEKGILTEEFTYDDSGRFLFDIKYYNNGNVKRYRDYFSKTIQEYNYDGSQKGELKTF